MGTTRSVVAALSAGLCVAASGQVYTLLPQWQSLGGNLQAGGLAVGDINRDGRMDVLVAAGQGATARQMMVFFGGNGGVPTAMPGWQSADVDNHHDAELVDINGDGWLDVLAVVDTSSGHPQAKYYLNNNGVLPAMPSWRSDPGSAARGSAIGDINSDGRPDLVVVSTPHPTRIYINQGGALPGLPTSHVSSGIQECYFVDGDRDGDLDLGMVSRGFNAVIYRNDAGVLGNSVIWTAAESMWGAAMCDGDLNEDGVRDLVVADSNNTMTIGTRRFQLFAGLAAGVFAVVPEWSFLENLFPTAVATGDIDHDGRMDLCTAFVLTQGNGAARYFLNDATAGFNPVSTWTSGAANVTDANHLVLADLNRDGVRRETATLPQQGARRLFYLPRQPIEQVLSVEVNGVTLLPSQYCFGRESGWISVGVTPTQPVKVNYSYSLSLDLVAGCQGGSVRAFLNQLPAPCAADFDGDGFVSGTDFDLFVQAFESGNIGADFDGDGFLTGIDYDGYVVAFEAGC